MALSDPQSVTLASVAKSLVRIITDKMSAVYALADGTLKLSVSHSIGRRNRTSIRLDQNMITTNPLNDVKNMAGQSAILIIDRKAGEFTNDQSKALLVALADYAKTANLDKILGGES